MSIVIDILLVATLVFFIVWYTKHGFARTIYRIGRTWLSLFTSLVVGPIVSGRIEAWFLSDSVTNKICSTLEGALAASDTGKNLEALFSKLPSGFVKLLSMFDIRLEVLEETYGASTEASHEMLMSISEKISIPLASLVAGILGHVFCFLVTFFFFQWINFQIRKRRVPLLRYIDHIFGFIVGVALGCTVVVAASMLLHTALQVIVAFKADSNAMQLYDKSFIFKFVSGLDVFGMFKQMFIK